jgi:hypothetical protein
MMGRGTVRNMCSLIPKYFWEISASIWFYYKGICHDARSHELKKKSGIAGCYTNMFNTTPAQQTPPKIRPPLFGSASYEVLAAI